MASDSSSSTPMVLTPESTGSDSISVKKKRRQTAFYPNTVSSGKKPQNPFSRSAAKRESVMALGSIEHLQHYFTKTGIAPKDGLLDKRRKGLVPAIGGLSHVHGNPALGGISEFELPPPPSVPAVVKPPQFVRTYETNPDSLLPGVVQDLTVVSNVWGINKSPDSQNPDLLSAPSNATTTSSHFNVLNNLKATTRAIRSIRNYVLSLPDESVDTLRIPANFRPSTLPSSAPVPKRITRQQSAPSDPLSLIRRAALEVLTVLRELEEKSRLPLNDDAYDAQSDHGSSPGRVASPSDISDEPEFSSPNPDSSMNLIHEVDPDTSISFSFVQVEGRSESIMVWEDEEVDINELDEEAGEKKGRWEERLVLGSGWLYKQDIKLNDLEKEIEVVKRYLDAVDDVLFGGSKDGKRGWERELQRVAKKEKDKDRARRVSASEFQSSGLEPGLRSSDRRVFSSGLLEATQGLLLTDEPGEIETVSEDDIVEDDELPEWAKRTSFSGDLLGRAHAVIHNFLPPHFSSALPSPADRKVFLQSLSSGQLLCHAHNACLRKSKKPWGYVNRDAIHDILALEQAQATANNDEKEKDEKTKKSWTFRRTDNLRLWAGALKLRYLLPIVTPNPPAGAQTPKGESPTPSSSSRRLSANQPPIVFDAPLIAKREEGWDVMLERLVLKWVEVVVEEQRGER